MPRGVVTPSGGRVSFILNPTIAAQLYADPFFLGVMGLIGEEAFEFMRGHIPVGETRDLYESARHTKLPRGVQRLSVDEPYWLYPEFGTENMDAEPYLRPTLTAFGLHVS